MKIIVTGDGTIIEIGKIKYGLDYTGPKLLNRYFISHAHSDHLSRNLRNKDVICSSPTAMMAGLKGIDMNLCRSSQVKLIESGHILGSSAFLIRDQILYTGDFNDRPRPFSQCFRPPKAKILLMEATYGRRMFIFPKESDVISEAKDKIYELLNAGRSVIILAYSLGKSQHLQMFFDQYFCAFKNYVWPITSRYDDIYRLFGAKIYEKIEVTDRSISDLMSTNGWLLYMPSHALRTPLYRELKNRGAISISFTGWAVHKNYVRSVGVDAAYPLSDHADFDGLVRIVERASPEFVVVTHGFISDFSSTLRRMGITTISEGARMPKLSRYLGRS